MADMRLSVGATAVWVVRRFRRPKVFRQEDLSVEIHVLGLLGPKLRNRPEAV